MKILFLLIAVITVSSTFTHLFSQSIKEYSGEFSNGSGTPGKATFSYYEKDGAKIKNGKFSYSQNVNGTYGFYNCTISGSYKDNNKDGAWTYNISFKDYNTGMGNIYATGSIKFTSNYIYGFPNGNWNYIETNQARSKTLTGWTAFDPMTTATVSANFKNGVLVGDFKMKGVDHTDISVTMDEKGFCNNEMICKNGISDIEETKYQFYKNILIKYVTTKLSSGQITEKSDFSESELILIKKFADQTITYDELKANSFKVDTNKGATNGFINLNSTFYNSNFLPSYIIGDNCYNVTFKGEGFYMITPKKIVFTKLTEARNYNGFLDYNSAIDCMQNSKSSEQSLKKALEGLNYILNAYEKSLSKEDLQTLKSKIIECENRIGNTKKQEINKEVEYKAIDQFDPANSDFETLEKFLVRANAYNELYPAKKSAGNEYIPSRIESKISKIKSYLDLRKQEARKSEFEAILVFDPKKQDKETLLKASQQIKSFKEKYRDISASENNILDEKSEIIEKAIKKCK